MPINVMCWTKMRWWRESVFLQSWGLIQVCYSLVVHRSTRQSLLSTADSRRSRSFPIQLHQSWFRAVRLYHGHAREIDSSIGGVLHTVSQLQADGTVSCNTHLCLSTIFVLFWRQTTEVPLVSCSWDILGMNEVFRLKPFLSLGFAVLATFVVIWLPVLRHDPIAVLKRLFPFERGLFEVSFVDRTYSNRNGPFVSG